MVDLIGARTPLRRSGARYVGRCPFHDERTPSFSVDPVKKVYYCFGCQRGGDHIAFVRETENLDFAAAVETLADRYGVRARVRAVVARRRAPPCRTGQALPPAGRCGRLLLPVSVGVGRGRARADVSRGAGDHRGDRPRPPPGVRAVGMGPGVRRRARQGLHRRRARPGRALGTWPPRAGRPVPRPPDVPAGRRPRAGAGVRRPSDAGRRAPEVPELAGRPALPQGGHPLRARPRPRRDRHGRTGHRRRGLHRRARAAPGRDGELRGIDGNGPHEESGDGAEAGVLDGASGVRLRRGGRGGVAARDGAGRGAGALGARRRAARGQRSGRRRAGRPGRVRPLARVGGRRAHVSRRPRACDRRDSRRDVRSRLGHHRGGRAVGRARRAGAARGRPPAPDRRPHRAAHGRSAAGAGSGTAGDAGADPPPPVAAGAGRPPVSRNGVGVARAWAGAAGGDGCGILSRRAAAGSGRAHTSASVRRGGIRGRGTLGAPHC